MPRLSRVHPVTQTGCKSWAYAWGEVLQRTSWEEPSLRPPRLVLGGSGERTLSFLPTRYRVGRGWG